MSRSRADLIILDVRQQLKLPGDAKSGMLYSRVAGLFLQGVLIENTPYKDTVYVWNLVMSLLVPRKHLVLTYGNRILDGAHVQGSRKDISAQIIASASHPSGIDLSLFERAITAQQFLAGPMARWDWRTAEPSTRIFDFGTLFAATGDFDRAVACFERCQTALAEHKGYPLFPACGRYLAASAEGENAVTALIDEIQSSNRTLLGMPSGDV